MKCFVFLALCIPLLNGCIVVPQTDTAKVNRCEISSDRKTLKVINGFEDTNTFYSISGLMLLPITGVVSGTYVAINNVYHLGEETLVCRTKDAAIWIICMLVAFIVDGLWLISGSTLRPVFNKPVQARIIRIGFAITMVLAVLFAFI